MNAQTQFPLFEDGSYVGTGFHSFIGESGKVPKISVLRRTTTTFSFENISNEVRSPDFDIASAQSPDKSFAALLPPAAYQRSVSSDSSVIQLWEGKVIDVDQDLGVMRVLLDAKMGKVPSHTGEIELQWVSDQDMDLVRPGAIFYLTLYKRTKRGSIENAQELRFRRLPSWTRQQIAQVERDANMLLSKMKARPIAE
jgi:hypothetical protein